MTDDRLLPDHAGKYYVAWMWEALGLLGARNYFEIGSRDGNSLRGVHVPSIAIDPAFALQSDVVGRKPACHLFQTTSDAFFRDHDPKRLFGRELDFAFLDGLHVFEFLLRDFINTEKHCRPNSIICLHDCLPCELSWTTRRQVPQMGWTGDVWKVPAILRRFRPDLRIHHLDCAPTGLVVCTNLDPSSRVLEQNYFDIIAEYRTPDTLEGEALREHYRQIEIVHAPEQLDVETLATAFWL